MRFITDIRVIEGNSSKVPQGYIKIDQDTNEGTGGISIYLCCKYEDNPKEFITDIALVLGENKIAKTGYDIIPIDVNRETWGEYIYVSYKKGTNINCGITDLLIVKKHEIDSYPEYIFLDADLNKDAFFGGSDLYLGYKPYMKSNEWMKYIADETPLNKIAIPGTHDTLTFDFKLMSKPVKLFSETQNMILSEQLRRGTRYVDIRIDEDLDGRHGITVCDYTFGKTMERISSFLSSNPSETVFMRLGAVISDNKKKEFNDKFKELFKIYKDLFWINNSNMDIPKLSEVRGKIVLLHDLGDVVKFDKNYGFRYGDNAIFSIQDDYNAPNEDKKLEKIIDNINNDIPDIIKINHVSATGTLAGALLVTWNPSDYARYLNPRVEDYIKGETYQTGILVYDFINPRISHVTFMNNFNT